MDQVIVNSVIKTDEYDKFKCLLGNRDVTTRRTDKIKKSIVKNGYIPNPIIVNQKYEIIDGQGRFQACKELGLPILYIVVDDIGMDECIAMNIGQTNWCTDDFVKSFAGQEVSDYVLLKEMVDKHGCNRQPWKSRVPDRERISYSAIYSIAMHCLNEGAAIKPVKEGRLYIYDRDTFEDRIIFCSKVFDVMALNPSNCGKNAFWVPACEFIYYMQNIDNDKFVERIRKNISKLRAAGRIEDAYKIYGELYNSGLPRKYQVDIYDDYRDYKRQMKNKKHRDK